MLTDWQIQTDTVEWKLTEIVSEGASNMFFRESQYSDWTLKYIFFKTYYIKYTV